MRLENYVVSLEKKEDVKVLLDTIPKVYWFDKSYNYLKDSYNDSNEYIADYKYLEYSGKTLIRTNLFGSFKRQVDVHTFIKLFKKYVMGKDTPKVGEWVLLKNKRGSNWNSHGNMDCYKNAIVQIARSYNNETFTVSGEYLDDSHQYLGDSHRWTFKYDDIQSVITNPPTCFQMLINRDNYDDFVKYIKSQGYTWYASIEYFNTPRYVKLDSKAYLISTSGRRYTAPDVPILPIEFLNQNIKDEIISKTSTGSSIIKEQAVRIGRGTNKTANASRLIGNPTTLKSRAAKTRRFIINPTAVRICHS